MGLVHRGDKGLGPREGGPGWGFEANPLRCEGIYFRLPGLRVFPARVVIVPFNLKKVLRLVPGGKERQDSVYHALKALQNEDELEIVLVHDGVRPFVTPEQIRQVIEAARRHGGAVLGLPAQDTLKRVNAEGKVHQTLERQDIWQIQTPQAFQAPLLWRAFTEAYSRNFYGTDEASLLEELQQPVAVVPGSPFNLKITTPEDLLLAEAIFSLRRRKKHASRPGV